MIVQKLTGSDKISNLVRLLRLLCQWCSLSPLLSVLVPH